MAIGRHLLWPGPMASILPTCVGGTRSPAFIARIFPRLKDGPSTPLGGPSPEPTLRPTRRPAPWRRSYGSEHMSYGNKTYLSDRGHVL